MGYKRSGLIGTRDSRSTQNFAVSTGATSRRRKCDFLEEQRFEAGAISEESVVPRAGSGPPGA